MKIDQLPSEILFHIGFFLDSPCNASQVSTLFANTIAQRCYEMLYKAYTTSSALKPYVTACNKENFHSCSKRKIVRMTYRTVMRQIRWLKVDIIQLKQEGCLTPRHLERVVVEQFHPFCESYSVLLKAIAQQVPEALAFKNKLAHGQLLLGKKAILIRAWMSRNEKNLARISRLNLAQRNLKFLPEETGLLKNLRILNLFGNQLVSLPVSIGQLIHLKRLNLSSNKLASLPALIGDLPCLQELRLFANPLKAIPMDLKKLVSTTQFYVQDGVTFEDGTPAPTAPIPSTLEPNYLLMMVALVAFRGFLRAV